MRPDPVTAEEISAFASRLISGGLAEGDVDRVDALRALEELKCVAEGRQVRETAALDASQRRAAAAAGVPAERQGRGIGHQVARARRESPHKGQRHVGLARVLDREMPCTRAALVTGRITEWRATVLARETACLPLEHREAIDEQLAGDADRLERMGDRELLGEVRRLAAELDPGAVAERRRRAEAERHVSIRPAPDTMAWFTGLLPVKDAVAAYASLKEAADHLVATGQAASRGQAMADLLVERVTGRSPSEPTPVDLSLVMTDRALLEGGDDPVHLDEWGPIPADLARDLVAAGLAVDEDALVAVRRLFARPADGQMVAMESTSRFFPKMLATLIRLRDRICRTPWCNAPVRHIDHVVEYAAGGQTSFDNGQGLCEACNHAKQAAGWRSRVVDPNRHLVETTTPTGHTYRSQAPPATGPPRPTTYVA